MSLFIETILVKNRRVPFLPLHLKRMHLTRKRFSLGLNPLKIELPKLKDNDTYRLRVTYGKSIENIELINYSFVPKRKVKIVNSDIAYSFKYKNREVFDGLLAKYQDYDDLLVVKNNVVTDTTIANVAFFDGRKWITPSTPLLKGTARERLLKSGFLSAKKINVEDVKSYTHIGFMNALSGFYTAGRTDEVIEF